MKKLKAMTRREALRIALLACIIIGAIEWLRTGTINGLCCLWLGPAMIMLDDWDPQEWARKKLEEMEK